jgi:hypothetical protein
MPDVFDHLRKAIDSLETRRDELRVKLHLGAADARDAFNRAEHKWKKEIEPRLEPIRERATEFGGAAAEAAQQLIDDLDAAYGEIEASLRKRGEDATEGEEE